MATRNEWSSRPNRESLSKRLGKTATHIKERDGHACVYCRATAQSSRTHLHLDHLTPRHLGGQDVAENLVVACRRCNDARKLMTLVQWAAYARAKYGVRFQAARIVRQAAKPLAA